MATIKIKIPDQDCKDCPFLKTEVIDHNYYGEKSIVHSCHLFCSRIQDFNRCDLCQKVLEDTEKEEAEFYRKLGDELEKVFLEFSNNLRKGEKNCLQ